MPAVWVAASSNHFEEYDQGEDLHLLNTLDSKAFL